VRCERLIVLDHNGGGTGRRSATLGHGDEADALAASRGRRGILRRQRGDGHAAAEQHGRGANGSSSNGA